MATWISISRVVAGLCLLGLVSAPGVVAAATVGPPADSRQTLALEESVSSQLVPSGFSDTKVATVEQPTGMAWTPDGRMLVISKLGKLVVKEEGQPTQVAIDLGPRLCTAIELGLLGIAVDPKFARNHFVYLYYTRDRGGACGEPQLPRQPVNQVGRFVLTDANTIARASETVIVGRIVSAAAHHVGGDLEFGTDGYLYISVGDGVCTVRGTRRCGGLNTNAQDKAVPHGKILRVGRGGRPAPTNPYVGRSGARRCTNPAGIPPGTGPCKEIFALGFRNPFRFARKPGTSTFYVNDVGEKTWEEVDRLAKGRNYGWNAREGFCARGSTTRCGRVAGFTNPIHAYRHNDNCRSITGGAFVPRGLWPGFDGAYLFADYTCGRVWRLDRRSDGTFRRALFSSGMAGPTQLRFGPHGDSKALYYLSIFSDSVRRISSTTVNTPPTAAFGYVPDGTTVAFSGAASSDGDHADHVETWSWDFGDGSPVVETTAPEVTHTYAAAGEYTAALTVTDSHGLASDTVSRTVHAGEHPPTVAITAPALDARFKVGQPFTVSATATDPEDGALPGSSISWRIKREHANHVHPFLGPVTGQSVSGTYPAPESLYAAVDSRLLVEVTVADSKGHTARATRVLRPQRATLTFLTMPRGGVVVLEGERVRTRRDISSWVGHVFQVRVPEQRIDGKRYVFKQWSDGKPRIHDITTPASPTTYVATLKRP